jgi:serine phosphatase RsbU (regulator of sigma subunit)
MLYSLDIGSTVELILFSIALGDKINSYRKETLKAQAENLQLVKEQNVVLEHKVTERTLALNETNEELNATLQTIAKQRDNIISSINYALRIQNAIIPKESEIQKYFPDSFVLFRPKDIVSGDFYWFADKGEKKIIVVADCTGHGVSGAFMTMIGNNMLNHIIHDQEITQPNEILNLMTPLLEKTLLHSEGKVKDGMDISIISIEQTQNLSSFQDLTSLKVEYSGAMNPLYYIENQEFKEIKADKVPIGGKQKEGFSYKNYELQVTNINNDELEITNYEKNNNDVISNSQFVIQNDVIKNSPFVIYLCTDGFQDQFGGTENRKFMVGKFKKLLLEISDKPMIEQKEILETTISNWILAGNETQTDDICVLGIRL